MGGSCSPVVWADRERHSKVTPEGETLCGKELTKTKAGKSTGQGQKQTLNQKGWGWQLQGDCSKEGTGTEATESALPGVLVRQRVHSEDSKGP